MTFQVDFKSDEYEGLVMCIFRSKRHRTTSTAHQLESNTDGNPDTKNVHKLASEHSNDYYMVPFNTMGKGNPSNDVSRKPLISPTKRQGS